MFWECLNLFVLPSDVGLKHAELLLPAVYTHVSYCKNQTEATLVTVKSIVLVKSSLVSLVLWWHPEQVFVKLAKSHDIFL